MDSRDNFIKEFEKLLQAPRDYSLQQWQYAYKHVVYAMGTTLIKKFPHIVFGADPSGVTTSPNKGNYPHADQGPGPGPGLGGHPYAIIISILTGVLQSTDTDDPDGKKHKK